MTSPTVDIVIATNRLSPYLETAVESVRMQTWPHWRLFVVDDGSPSPEYIEEVLATVPQSTVIRQDHRGVAAARNAGIRAGTSPLVAFLDDDDVWHPKKLEFQVAAWRDAPHRVGVFSGGWYVDGEGRTFGDGWAVEQTSSMRFVSGEVPLPRIVSLMVTRSICQTIGGFDETFSIAEDNEFILRLVQHGELSAVPEALVGYRRHDFNTTAIGQSTDGWRASDRLIRMQIDAALRRGDATTSLLLRQNLTNYKHNAAEAIVSDMISSVRRRNPRALRDQLTWGMQWAPGQVAAAFIRRSSGAAGRRLLRRRVRGGGTSDV